MKFSLRRKDKSPQHVEPTPAELQAAKELIVSASTLDAMVAETAAQISQLTGATGGFITIDGTDARTGEPLNIHSETAVRLTNETLVRQGNISAIPIEYEGRVTGFVAAESCHVETLSALARFATESYGARQSKPTRFTSSAKVDFDGLTGVGNRRRFDNDLAEVVADAGGKKIPVSLAMFDIDDFRYYNEAHGKQAGNEVLRSVAELIASNLRGTDVVYRYSGVKFVALLPGATVDNGYAVVERIRDAVETTHFEGEEVQPTGRVTLSVGIAEAPADQTDNLIEAADAALLTAKESGRNKVVIEADIR